jgi:hypothetical protein
VGTIGDWSQIAAIAVFVGLYEWARDMGRKPYPNKLGRLLAGWFLISTALCIWLTFSLRAFQVPLVFVTAPAGVGGVILRYFAGPRSGQESATEPSAPNDK